MEEIKNNLDLQDILVNIKSDIIALEKKLINIDKQIEKAENEDKLIMLTLRRRDLKKEYKFLLNKYSNFLEENSSIIFNNLTLKDARIYAYNNYEIISNRGKHDINKWTYYYSGINYDYEKSIVYYMMIAYAVNLMASLKKRINRYIKVTDVGMMKATIFCDTLEFYYKNNGCGKYIAYIKRLLKR